MSEPGLPLQPDPALERLLSEIFIRMRQGKYADAAERLARAKALAPDHPAVLEIEGDIAFAQGRFHKARDLYKQAFDINPKNAKLEEKFATALLQTKMPQLMTHQLPDDSFWSNRVPRHPVSSLLLSLILPGFGQVYNGDWLKGLVIIFAALILGAAQSNLLWKVISAWVHHEASGSTISTLGLFFQGPQALLTILLLGVWVYASIDAWYVAKHSK